MNPFGPVTPASGVPTVDLIERPSAFAQAGDDGGLTWLPAWKLRDMIVGKEVSSVEVVKHFLTRIEELDPHLQAFRELDAQESLKLAALSDRALQSDAVPGLLHGVPIAIKELFSVQGMPVPGSYFSYLASKGDALPLSDRDDLEVERLRAAGAIIVGMTTAAAGIAPGMDLAQLPRNPWDLSRTPGSSSAGNGAAVAGGLIPMAIGDDGGGSIRLPAALCGLVALHPTRGRIPHVDYKSLAPRPTVMVGPMTRSVRDAAIALQVLSGPDGRDFVCIQDEPPDFIAGMHEGVKGKRFAWTDNFGLKSTPISSNAKAVISTVFSGTVAFTHHGASVVRTSMTWESPVRSWMAAQQLITGTNVAGIFEEPLSPVEVNAALASRARNWERFREIFRTHDFVLAPTIDFTAPKIEDWVDLWKRQGGQPSHGLWLDEFAGLIILNVLGLPAISVPAGYVDGLPVAIQIIGKAGSEAQLLQAADVFITGNGT